MRILFVTNTGQFSQPYLDQSARYRCYNIAECLAPISGYSAFVSNIAKLDKRSLQNFDVVIFHRPNDTRVTRKAIDYLDKRNVLRIADFDDLIFDPVYAADSPMVRNGFRSSESVSRQFADCHSAVSTFRHITVSTEPLKQRMNVSFPQARCRVVRNGLSHHWLSSVNSDRASQPSEKAFVIGYFSGSKSHDRDFASVAGGIRRYLDSDRTAKLLVVGHINTDKADLPKDRIVRTERVPYEQLPELLQRCNVTIGPLESTRFNDCKSGIKLLESLALGVPFVGSPIEDISRHTLPYRHTAKTEDDWLEALTEIRDICLNKPQGAQCQSTTPVLATHSATALLNFIDEPHSVCR